MIATRAGTRIALINEIMDSVRAQDPRRCADGLRALADGQSILGDALPTDFLRKTASALEGNDWTDVGEDFVQRRFVGTTGEFVLVGYLTIRRGGVAEERLTAVAGNVSSIPDVALLDKVARAAFGPLREPVPISLPIRVTASAGAIGGESGEAFIVPDAWNFPGSANGPSLNDMIEQRNRFDAGGREAIRRIFEADTAALLLEPFGDHDLGDATRAREYQGHEVGHAAGHGLAHKLNGGLLTNNHMHGVEEFRADGVSFALAPEYLTKAEVEDLIASNLCTRFGVDAHRLGGIGTDRDLSACLLQFYALFEGGGLIVGPTGRLSLSNVSRDGLWQTTELQRAQANALTRQELQLSNPVAIGMLYSRLSLPQSVIALYDAKVIGPCRGLYSSLR